MHGEDLICVSCFGNRGFYLNCRKWKITVDEWVKVNQPQGTANLIGNFICRFN